jgi:hypothetical protein
MIRYSLACERGHAFEGWFPSSTAYDDLTARGLNTCAICGSPKVEKQLMAPSVSTSRKRAAQPAAETVDATAASPEAAPVPVSAPLVTEQEARMRAMLRELHEHVKANTEDVGQSFPDQALKMHIGEIEHRPIRGKATADEAKALIEEGVPVAPLPPLPDAMN